MEYKIDPRVRKGAVSILYEITREYVANCTDKSGKFVGNPQIGFLCMYYRDILDDKQPIQDLFDAEKR